MRHAYFGPAFDDDAIEKPLRTYKLRYTRLSDLAASAAELLSNGQNHRLVSGAHGVWARARWGAARFWRTRVIRK